MRLSHASFVRPVIVLLLMSVAAIAVSQSKPVRADSSFGLDGVGSNGCQRQFCQDSQLLTTTQSNDVIVVVAQTDKIISVSDSFGLDFSRRSSYTSPVAQTGYNTTLWEYYAVAASPLESDNITVLPGTCCYIVGMQVFAIRGADASIIFDQNPSVPARVSCPGSGCGDCTANFNQGTCSASIQTSSVDFVVASTAINDAGPCGSGYPNRSPPGFTNLTNQYNRFEVDYKVTTTPQTQVRFDCNGTDAVAIVLDAIAVSVSPPGPYTLKWQGYDWDGSGEETVTLNGQFIASVPTTDSQQNAGIWATFSINITSFVVKGTNTLTFTHANWDCGVSDNVQNLQVTNGTAVVYDNSTSLPLSCTQSLTYTFTT